MAAPEDLYNEILADGPSPGTLFRLLLKMKEESSKKLSHELALEYFFSNDELRDFFNQMYQKSIGAFI